jgi:hypothetical protein
MQDVVANCAQSCKLCDVEWPTFEPLACDVAGGENADIREKDSVLAWLLGQYPAVDKPWPFDRYAGPLYSETSEFPSRMSGVALFPESSSVYTDVDGIEHEVSCFIPGAESTIQEVQCPAPFLPPIEKSSRPCVQPW